MLPMPLSFVISANIWPPLASDGAVLKKKPLSFKFNDPNKSFIFSSSNYKENYRHKLTKKSDISYVMFCLKQKYESMK